MMESPSRQAATTTGTNDRGRRGWWWEAAVLLVVLVGLGLRYGTDVLNQPTVRDEALMKAPIDAILERGWSVETAIDYQEVKGPAFFWSYALPAEVLGGDMNDLRMISLLFFAGGVIPLLLLARRGGLAGPGLVLVAALYALLPYNAFLGQLLFSEPSFIFYALWLMWVFAWGIDQPAGSAGRRLGLVVFTVLLAILLHHRPHAVALGAAAILVALEREGARSWPWWVAGAVAGLSRVPLYLRWGGFVTSEYQGIFATGVRPENLVYLLAVVLTPLAIFLWPALVDTTTRRRWRWLLAAAAMGLLLAFVFPPRLGGVLEYVQPSTGETAEQMQYAGVVGTGVRRVVGDGFLQTATMAVLAAAGAAALTALWLVVSGRAASSAAGVTGRLAFWTIAAGLPLYALTTGPVYDRYLAVWIVLLPIVWATKLPRAAVIVQAMGLAAVLGYLVHRYLM